MTALDARALLPYLILAYGAVVVLVVGAFWRRHAVVAGLAALVLAASLLTLPIAASLSPRQVTPLLRLDALALFYFGLFLVGGLVLVVLSRGYLDDATPGHERYYALLLFALLGMGVLAASSHFAAFFLGFQTLSVSLYGLIGYTRQRRASLEGSLKYIILGGVSLSFLLFGIALVYAEYGTMEFAALAARISAEGPHLPALVLFGMGLIVVAFAFKLALAPFHTWAPDVYQGAPAPITALLATGSKAAMFALLLRFVALVGMREGDSLYTLLQVLSIATMCVGNLLALTQRNLKRLLAYSSVAHMGYLLIPLLAGGEAGVSSLAFYFVSYFLTTIAAFGVIAALSREGEEVETLDGYQGLGARRPFLAAVLALAMLSLAGIPLTIGFMAKFAIFSAAAHAQLWLLLVLGLVNSGVSAYYYLQVLAAMYLRAPAEEAAWRQARPASVAVLAVLSLSVLAFGVYPGPLLTGTQYMARAWLGEERSERRVVTTRARGGQTASLLLQVEQLPQRADQHGLGVRGAGALAKRGDGLVK